ncbi:MAG: ATP-binding cassette domain-containing protein, partial [Deltaproteobacteria bacterium]|nr:ATP-binding cassette domain-containing protein [Deltaproteobacteria bacterium]
MQIEFENVSKYFFVPSKELSFRQAFISFSKGKQIKKEVLNNIHFSIQKGEFVGIIGPNGCGKSTILKLIGGILWPNVGRITVIGKVAPLLELGAGFHPDLTGRENIYLYGSILGFKKKEIDQKFEEMVLFSEMKDFLNLKIKHYSSGMAARLG